MNGIQKAKLAIYSAASATMMFGAVSAQNTVTGIGRVGCAAGCFCGQLMTILPVISMLMVIGAGVVYAGGQMMGAETRARANTWATAMIVGAVIGIIIVVVSPAILNTMYGNATQINSSLCDVSLCDACA
ncbi:MAG: hypothetical protein WC492_03455 [Candidatus Micrarchaeia archaeon]